MNNKILFLIILFFFASCEKQSNQDNVKIKDLDIVNGIINKLCGSFFYCEARFEINRDGITELYLNGGEGGTKITFDEEINKLKNIRCLSMNNLKLDKLISIDSLDKIIQLDLSCNNLKNIEVNNIPSTLKSINFSINNIELIKFASQSNVEELNLVANKLKEIDSSIKRMSSLKKLYISINEIQDLDLTMLPNLELVVCKKNPIKDTLNIIQRHRGQKTKFIF